MDDFLLNQTEERYTMHTPAKIDLSAAPAPASRTAPHRTRSCKRSPQIVLPTQPTNTEAVRAFMRDCLVPILAQEFLRRRDEAAQTANTVNGHQPISQSLGMEDGN